jgi:septal ring factor EnvC (AmiA/AmiB activator)
MPREVNSSHVKAARLRESGVEWNTALKTAKVPDTDDARQSVRRIIRELVSTAKAKAQAERDAADAEVRAKRKDLKARETALRELVSTAKAKAQAERDAADAEVRAKRKDLKARETALKLAERKAIPKRCFDRSVKPGCGPSGSGSGGASSGGGGAAASSSSTSESAVDLTAETPETMVAVKAKLKVARRTLREANKNKGRVKKQGKGMAIKLKGAREAGRRVVELEREVAGLREDAAGARAAAAAAGGREEEFFSMKRDSTKRGAPYDPTFEELIAPAMMASGASGNVIGEILRTCTLLAFRCFYL